jgi:hypothetical protein
MLQVLGAIAGFVALAATGGMWGCGDGEDAGGSDTEDLPVVATFFGADEGDSAAALAQGDFDGDGELDVALGAAFADGPEEDKQDAGEVVVFRGPFAEGAELDAGSGEQWLTVYGAEAGDNLGRSLAAGDFDGDGVDDLAMGAPGTGEDAGGVHVVFGSGMGGDSGAIDLSLATNGLHVLGEDPGDFTGLSLAAGDVSGDERDDLLVPALLADGPGGEREDAGAVHILTAIGPGPAITLPAGSMVVHGADAGDRLGEALTTGDFNADGRPDAVLVAPFAAGPDNERPDAGETYVFFSATGGTIDLRSQAADVTVIGSDDGDQLGHSVAAAANLAGSPARLWLGAVSADGRENAADLAGEGVIVDTDSVVVDTRTDPAGVMYGPEAEARLGRQAVSTDLNGDGLGDVVMSASDVNGLSGALFLALSPGDIRGEEIEPSTRYDGIDEGDYLGSSAFGFPAVIAGPDGTVLVSAPHGDGPDNSRTDCGEAYLIRLGTTAD